MAEMSGIACSLTYADVHKAICGFFCNLSFNVEKAFSCPQHGSSPKWIVADGKALGPLKRRVSHLREFDIAPGDKCVLEQTTHHKDRIFISSKKERVIVLQLVTGEISTSEFCLNNEITSANGKLVKNVVAHIEENFPLRIPNPYTQLLSNVAKNSSARSLMQVNNLESLEILSKYCRE